MEPDSPFARPVLPTRHNFKELLLPVATKIRNFKTMRLEMSRSTLKGQLLAPAPQIGAT